jgi:arginine N-succinyltransferase
VFTLRSVSLEDLDDLYELSGKVFFINLPHDKRIITEKINSSIKSFTSPSEDLSKNYYIFVLVDEAENKVIGVSMIHAQHGTEKEPHFFLRVSSEHKYSQTINTGFVHGTLRLGLDTNGPTEIGGLVVSPDYRGNPEKLGKQISFVRFLYMALNKDRFKNSIHSELMPPLDDDGNSPLWEAIGRRFMNMDYSEADKLSRSNKEFILSLFPSDNIYMTLLPYEARNAIGKVGPDTAPVKAMLENIGFTYVHEVDPFDGGPHYRCNINDIQPIKETKLLKLRLGNLSSSSPIENYLVTFNTNDHPFIAIKAKVEICKENTGVLDPTIVKKYKLQESTEIWVTPF